MTEGIVRLGKRDHLFMSVFVPPLVEKEWQAYHSELYPAQQIARDDQGYVRAAVYDLAIFAKNPYKAQTEFIKYVTSHAARIDYEVPNAAVMDMAALRTPGA